MEPNISIGIEGEKQIVVTPEKTATAYGSGTVDVLATPAMIALMEQTAIESVSQLVPEGFITVGTEVSVKHFKATLPGKVVSCNSKLMLAEGSKLVFDVSASDESGLIGKGTHTRYIVDKQKFIDDLQEK
jgi:fluoroacetyl-CoA thioesterase